MPNAVLHDKQIMPVMLALRDALHAALACSPAGPVDRIDLIPRDRRDMRGCECSRSWIRWAGDERLDQGRSCANPVRRSIEVGILRCLPYNDVKDMPPDHVYQKATDNHLGDAAAIRRAMRESKRLRDAQVTTMGPYGPEGDCMGTVAVIEWRSC